MKNSWIIFLILILGFNVKSQTFDSGKLNLPLNSKTLSTDIKAEGLPGTTGPTFGLKSVCIKLSQQNPVELNLWLTAPNGTSVLLTASQPISGHHCFTADWESADRYFYVPDKESLPQESYGAFNKGLNPNGLWSLSFKGKSGGEDAWLESWDLSFDFTIKSSFTSSTFPIIHIKSRGQHLNADYEAKVDFGIIYNGEGKVNFSNGNWNHYNGKALLKVRGNSSQMYPKRNFTFTTIDESGEDLNFPVLGMPAENKWVLHAAYADKSLMRNFISYRLFRDMGYYSVRSRYVEVVLDDDYRGVYLLTEAIKRDKNRVGIAKLEPDDTDITGGYIVRIDRPNPKREGWYSHYPSNLRGDKSYFQYEYPKPSNITDAQKAYIREEFHKFENTLMGNSFADPEWGYRRHIDVASFVDNFILNELSKNVDAYRLSAYFQKDRDDRYGKIVNAPVWDFDLAWFNADYGGGNVHNDWQYKYGGDYAGDVPASFITPFWWRRFMEDPDYVEHVNCRYFTLRSNGNILEKRKIYNLIDSVASSLNEAQQRNFQRWPVLGVYVWPNPEPHEPTYQGEVDKLKAFIDRRVEWLDANMPGECNKLSVEMDIISSSLQLYPNPTQREFQLQFQLMKESSVIVKLVNAIGQPVFEEVLGMLPSGFHTRNIELNHVPAGIYFVDFIVNQRSYQQKLVKVRE
jgi:hypothetical protein